MGIPKLPFSFPDFVKYPLQAVVYLLLAYFVFKEFTRGHECDDLRQANIVLSKRVDKLEKDKDDLTWAVAVKSGVINQLKSKQDSISKP
ncbi:MAG: hypothetical protein ABIN91_05490 [Mucilaginibacter sp.]|uniref:hypothetical protein n=1 Tax=Mucilaginibacter sp. TaxID=1882438 RepID=UPI003264F91B